MSTLCLRLLLSIVHIHVHNISTLKLMEGWVMIFEYSNQVITSLVCVIIKRQHCNKVLWVSHPIFIYTHTHVHFSRLARRHTPTCALSLTCDWCVSEGLGLSPALHVVIGALSSVESCVKTSESLFPNPSGSYLS